MNRDVNVIPDNQQQQALMDRRKQMKRARKDAQRGNSNVNNSETQRKDNRPEKSR